MTPKGKKKSKSKAKKSIEDLSLESQEFFEEMKKETDRGVALIGAEFINAILEQVLKSHFIDNAKHVNALLKKNQPLGSLWSRSEIAYCIGLLPEPTFHDLDLIRQIRNEFAHNYVAQTFDSEIIENLCLKLKSPDITLNIIRLIWKDACLDNRDRYIASIVSISDLLIRIGRKLRRCESPKLTLHFRRFGRPAKETHKQD